VTPLELRITTKTKQSVWGRSFFSLSKSVHWTFIFDSYFRLSKSLSLRDEVIDASEAVQSLLMLQHSSVWKGESDDNHLNVGVI